MDQERCAYCLASNRPTNCRANCRVAGTSCCKYHAEDALLALTTQANPPTQSIEGAP